MKQPIKEKGEEIEKLDVIHMRPFPDGSIYDIITIAHKLNEVIDFINKLQ